MSKLIDWMSMAGKEERVFFTGPKVGLRRQRRIPFSIRCGLWIPLLEGERGARREAVGG